MQVNLLDTRNFEIDYTAEEREFLYGLLRTHFAGVKGDIDDRFVYDEKINYKTLKYNEYFRFSFEGFRSNVVNIVFSGNIYNYERRESLIIESIKGQYWWRVNLSPALSVGKIKLRIGEPQYLRKVIDAYIEFFRVLNSPSLQKESMKYDNRNKFVKKYIFPCTKASLHLIKQKELPKGFTSERYIQLNKTVEEIGDEN
ncbi:MAG: hypothetical protein QXL94_01555 [Candidatus Parvarchaeum sp.]